MAYKIIRELAAALGISEQTMVRRLRFELDEDHQLEMLMKIEEIAKRKERSFEESGKE